MEPIRVLIVDDEVEFLETLVKRLRKRNLAVDGVTSGEAALELLKASPVDVVLLDVKMPGMSGLDTLREIRKGHNLIEVIMLTGHASVEAALEGMAVGAFDYLMKPTDTGTPMRRQRSFKAGTRTKTVPKAINRTAMLFEWLSMTNALAEHKKREKRFFT